jgi:hypothetical protein
MLCCLCVQNGHGGHFSWQVDSTPSDDARVARPVTTAWPLISHRLRFLPLLIPSLVRGCGAGSAKVWLHGYEHIIVVG